MQIHIISNYGITISLTVDPSDTAESILEAFNKKLRETHRDKGEPYFPQGELSDYRATDYRLIFAGKQLEDSRTLQDYNIADGARFHTIIRPDSGADYQRWQDKQARFLSKLKNEFLTKCKENKITLSPDEKILFVDPDGLNKTPDRKKILDCANSNPNSALAEFLLSKKLLLKNPNLTNQNVSSNLVQLIEHKCSNLNYWKTKVRAGYGTPVEKDTKIPQAVAQILDMIKNFQGNDQDLLKNIGKLAEHKHSAHFQWAHAFFRGRDEQTNKFYGVLARLGTSNANQEVVMTQIMKELENQFEDPAVDDSKNQKLV